MTTATIGKWGNASAIRLPQPFCEQLGIGVGDAVQVTIEGRKRIVIEPPAERYTLEARMAGWDGGRFDTCEYDWGSPVGKEIW